MIYDISDRRKPKYVNRIPVSSDGDPTDGIIITKDGNTLISGEGYGGIKIVDMSDKTDLKVLKHFYIDGDSDDFKLTNNEEILIVGHGTTGCSLVDITNLSNPEIVYHW